MVKLTLTPHRGNGARTFPSTGCLGLTPVTLAGVVRVKIEEDLKSIEASSLVVRVRCYESIGGGASTASSSSSTSINGTGNDRRRVSASAASGTHSSNCLGGPSSSYSFTDMLKGGSSGTASNSSVTNSKGRVLYEKSIQMWTPPSSPLNTTKTDNIPSSSSPTSSRSSSLERSLQQHAYPPRSREASNASSSSFSISSQDNNIKYATLGEFTKAWRIVIPVNAIEQGAKSTMIFKNWRIWWAVEAVISHQPLGIHGDKIIKSHQVALVSYAPLPALNPPLNWSSSSTDPHPLAYNITTPISSFGSNDPVSFEVKLSKKSAMAETPKKVIIELRREICYCSPSGSGILESSPSTSSNQSFETHHAHNSLTKSKPPKHTRSSSGGILSSIILPPPPAAHIVPSSSKFKSESQEALVTTPPPLSNTSTMSSFSAYMPSTPPVNVPTPGDHNHHDSTSESYFGLFDVNANSTKSKSYPSHHTYIPPAPIPITLPSSAHSRNNQDNHNHTNNNSKRRKEEIATLATFEIDCLFNSSNWQGKIQGNIPKSKSIYHYALGETCHTSSGANSKFYFVPKIQYKNKNSFIELPKVEFSLFNISAEERKKAIEMKGKILAVQKAEARLFGGDDDDVEEFKKDEEARKKKNKGTIKGAATSNSSNQNKSKSVSSSPRVRVSQSVSPKVGTGGGNSSITLPLPITTTRNEDEDDMPRLSTVRRRSEQAESLLETPSRTRQRFGSTSDLSPIVGSPYLDAVSPSLSIISSSTTRPRTGGNGARSRPNTGNSNRSSTLAGGNGAGRPRSSAGLDSSNWSTFSNSTGNFTFDPVASAELSHLSSQTTSTTVSSTSSEPPSYSSVTSSSNSPSSIDQSPKSIKENINPQSHFEGSDHYKYSPVTPATVNGLFADFSGFSLRPPPSNAVAGVEAIPRTPIIREELVAPNSATPQTSTSKRGASHAASLNSATASNKRKSTEILNHSAKGIIQSSAPSSTSSSTSSPIIALHEITLASPPASIRMNPNNAIHNSSLSPNSARSMNMSKATSHDSNNSRPMELINSPSNVYGKHLQQDNVGLGSPRRVKSGMSGAFSFFRRSSTRT